MWQKFRKREEAIKVYYKDKGEPARDHLPRTAVDGVISWEPVSMHWNIIWSLHLETMPCWVWPQVSGEGTHLPGRYYPTPPHPTASGDDAMLSVATSVTEEGTQLPGRYYPTPPHRIWRRCHVECGCKCVSGRNAAARTLLSHPTPPHPPASGDDAMLSVATSVSEEGTQLPGRYYPTPPHPTRPHLETMPCWVWPQVCQRKERSCQDVIIPPHPTPPHLETMLCWLWPQLWRGCWFLSRADGGWGMAFSWLRNPLVLVAESPFFGCGSAFSWLRKRVWFW